MNLFSSSIVPHLCNIQLSLMSTDQPLTATQQVAVPLTYAARACENCRSKKQKCSGTDPCSRCLKAGIPCVFPASTAHSRRGACFHDILNILL